MGVGIVWLFSASLDDEERIASAPTAKVEFLRKFYGQPGPIAKGPGIACLVIGFALFVIVFFGRFWV